jgi:hypothetical protein
VDLAGLYNTRRIDLKRRVHAPTIFPNCCGIIWTSK